MLDRKFIVENADAREGELPAPRLRRPTSIASSSWSTRARQKQHRGRGAESPGERSVARRSARPRTPPSARPARRKAAGCASRSTAAQAELDQLDGRGRRDPAADSQPVASRRAASAPTTRPTSKSAAASTSRRKFDFKPLDHVRARREARPDRLRRRARRSPATASTS